MTIKVEDIRARFPTPVSCYKSSADTSAYCVAGAFLMYCHPSDSTRPVSARFPGSFTLWENLWIHNPRLPRDWCPGIARQIIDENDKGNLEEAWGILGRALSYDPKRTRTFWQWWKGEKLCPLT